MQQINNDLTLSLINSLQSSPINLLRHENFSKLLRRRNRQYTKTKKKQDTFIEELNINIIMLSLQNIARLNRIVIESAA